jgi:hypothetical protein
MAPKTPDELAAKLTTEREFLANKPDEDIIERVAPDPLAPPSGGGGVDVYYVAECAMCTTEHAGMSEWHSYDFWEMDETTVQEWAIAHVEANLEHYVTIRQIVRNVQIGA